MKRLIIAVGILLTASIGRTDNYKRDPADGKIYQEVTPVILIANKSQELKNLQTYGMRLQEEMDKVQAKIDSIKSDIAALEAAEQSGATPVP